MAYERIIVEVNTDDNTAVLSVSSPTVSDRGFTVSSHIDVNYNGMRELFHRLAEEHYDINTRADAPLRRTSKFERMQAMKAAMTYHSHTSSCLMMQPLQPVSYSMRLPIR